MVQKGSEETDRVGDIRVGDIWRKVKDTGKLDAINNVEDRVEIILVDGDYIRWKNIRSQKTNGWDSRCFTEHYQIDGVEEVKRLLDEYL
jgi:hypothetical protein